MCLEISIRQTIIYIIKLIRNNKKIQLNNIENIIRSRYKIEDDKLKKIIVKIALDDSLSILKEYSILYYKECESKKIFIHLHPTINKIRTNKQVIRSIKNLNSHEEKFRLTILRIKSRLKNENSYKDISKRIEIMSNDALYNLYINNVMILCDTKKEESHYFSEKIIADVCKEFSYRVNKMRHLFEWPNTDIYGESYSKYPNGSDSSEGMLKYLGYTVGKSYGKTKKHRQTILDFAFRETLPPYGNYDYYKSWGKNQSEERLKKIAYTISKFCKHAKNRKNSDCSDAIMDWEDDLLYLYNKYYLNKFYFTWLYNKN